MLKNEKKEGFSGLRSWFYEVPRRKNAYYNGTFNGNYYQTFGHLKSIITTEKKCLFYDHVFSTKVWKMCFKASQVNHIFQI